MDITLELLEILDAIDRRGSFAAAAEELERVPSALSYSIQKYEEKLGARIFARQGRRSVFTPAGRLLLERGRQLLAAADAMTVEVQTLASGWEPRINIAVDSLMPVDEVMTVVADFLRQHPGVEIDISEEVLGGAWEALIEDRVQLVVGAPDPKPAGHGIQTHPLGVLERVFAVQADHPLTQLPQPVRQHDIAPYPLVIVHDSSRSTIPRASHLLNPDRHFYVQTIAQKLAAQRTGIGVGFLPRRLVEPLVSSGEMAMLAVADVELADHLFLAWKSANRGQGLKALLALFRQASFNL